MIDLNRNNFKITGTDESPENINYDIFGFHKKRTIVTGELRLVQYYRNFDGANYSDLILEESRSYTRDINGMVMYRNQNVKWYLHDDTIGVEKNSIKFYSPQESIDEGISRRGNIIANAKLYVLGHVGLANGQDFLASVTLEVSLFMNGFTQPLRDAVAATTKPYMNPTLINTTVAILTF